MITADYISTYYLIKLISKTLDCLLEFDNESSVMLHDMIVYNILDYQSLLVYEDR